MSNIYLIRHGQAGSRANYDLLSDLGERQAGMLGDHLAERGMRFDSIYAGELRRQQQTAAIASSRLDALGLNPPSIVTDNRWNEFSLATVYQGLVPRLIADSESFASDFEEMQRALIDDPHTTRGAAGRCDRAVIEAWMDNRYPDYQGDSWEGFRTRVRSIIDDFLDRDPDEQIAVFTSATPIAIWAGSALSLPNDRILRLMAVLYNSSMTTIRIRFGEPLLFNFNMTPHLSDPSLVTHR